MVCLYLRVYSIIFYVVRQVVGGKFFAAGRRASAAGVTGGGCAPGGGAGGTAPFAALAHPAPGERTISNAEVPLPRSPLSLAAGTAHQCRVPTATPPVGTVNARRAGNAGGKPPRKVPAWQAL